MPHPESPLLEAFVPTLAWPGRRPSLAEVSTWHEALRDAVGQVIPLDLLACWLLPARGGSMLLGPAGLHAADLEIPAAEPLLVQESLFQLEDRLAQAQVSSWLSFEQTQHMHAFAQPRLLIHLRQTAKTDDPDMVAWRAAGMKAAALMDAHLAGREFLVGALPTIADIALYPYTSMAGEGGYDLSGFANITAWLARMRALPGFTPLMETA